MDCITRRRNIYDGSLWFFDFGGVVCLSAAQTAVQIGSCEDMGLS